MGRFSTAKIWGVLLAALFLAPTAQAQFSESYNFLKSVRDRKAEGDEAIKLINANPTSLVNTRDKSTEETALHIVVRDKDSVWTKFLLGKGANPNLADKDGMTPLMHAAMLDWAEGADLLIARGARVDQVNRRGETALILAVQNRKTAMVRSLMANKANPDRADHIAGMSARDYARRDDRTGAMLALLDAKVDDGKMPTGPIFGPK